MYILKNAFKNLTRNKGRNLLIGFITLAIIIAVSASIVINTTVESITKDYKTRFGAEVSLYFDYEKSKQYSNLQNPTAELTMDIGKSELLQKTNYEATITVVLNELKALDEDAMGDNSISSSLGNDRLSTNARVKAYSTAEEFTNGKREIIEGRMFENKDECVISEEFAKLNGLSVGDKITVTNDNKKSLMPHALTICGIYADNTANMSPAFRHPLLNRGNEIVVSIETAFGMELFDDKGDLSATYFLKEPGLLEAFAKEAREKGLPEYYRATIDEEGYNRIVGPVEGIAGIVSAFLTLVLVFGGIILLFLSVMAIRERKYEIGVLRAMGMKRIKLIAGMVCESLLIAGVCLVIGLGLATTLSQPIADTLLEDQLRLAEEQREGTFELVPGDESKQAVSEISVSLTPQAIIQIVSLALLLIVISSLSGVLYISKFEPMKILSERG